MKINIVAVGKIKEKFLTDGINEYIKRLGAYTNVNIIEIAEETSDTPMNEKSKLIGDYTCESIKY